MATVREHKRLARLIERGAQRALDAVSDSPEPEPPAPPPEPDPEPEPEPRPGPEPGAAARFVRTAERTLLGNEPSASTTRLYERLDPSEVQEIETMIRADDDLRAHFELFSDPYTRRHLILANGIWLGHPSVSAKTGLPSAQPEEDIHQMASGPTAAAGGLYEADIVCNALTAVGADIEQVGQALDFGCSSGRVVRVLAAAFPNVDWKGCDPNAPAIEWANQNLAGIDFHLSGNEPPLQLEDGSLGLAYAISIWSHFAPDLGALWFEEMHRLIRPGGYLVCTTHGNTSVAYYATLGLRSPQQSDEIVGALYREGSWYAPEFGEEGDWGVINPRWGTAFLSPEWMLTQLCPRWRVLDFAAGRNQENQDVYVLQRV